MPQCEGITKSGGRCKRSAGDDSVFCSVHVGQRTAETSERRMDPEPEAGHEPEAEVHRRPRRDQDSFGRLALIGIVTLALLVIRRVIRH